MPPVTLSPLLADQFPPDLLEEADARLGQQRDEANAIFAAAAASLGKSIEWREVEGDAVDLAAGAARQADLTILGQASPDDAAPGITPDFPERVTLEAGRPVLVIPYAGSFPSIGKRVLVAWSDTPQAARAVGDALPLMAGAETVAILSITPEGDEGEEIAASGVALAQSLARHGVKAEPHHLAAGGVGIGDLLLSRAADEAADLIVMGVYGHSRLRELVLGGVSRDIFEHMTVPVLMAH